MEQRSHSTRSRMCTGPRVPAIPRRLIADVVSYAELKQNDKILEVGCGTGQATESFAKRGFSILALDPGPEMLRGARESLASFNNVGFLETTFEAWPAKRRRVSADLRCAVVALGGPGGALREGGAARFRRMGRLQLFGHVPVGLPAALIAQFKEIYLRQIGRWGSPPEAWYLPDGPFKGWFDESGLFGPVVAHKLRVGMAAHDIKLHGFLAHEIGASDARIGEA